MGNTARVACQIFDIHKIYHNLFNSQQILMIKGLNLHNCQVIIYFYNIFGVFAGLNLFLIHLVQDHRKPVWSSFWWFLVVLVHNCLVLGISGTGPDLKALVCFSVFFFCLICVLLYIQVVTYKLPSGCVKGSQKQVRFSFSLSFVPI